MWKQIIEWLEKRGLIVEAEWPKKGCKILIEKNRLKKAKRKGRVSTLAKMLDLKHDLFTKRE